MMRPLQDDFLDLVVLFERNDRDLYQAHCRKHLTSLRRNPQLRYHEICIGEADQHASLHTLIQAEVVVALISKSLLAWLNQLKLLESLASLAQQDILFFFLMLDEEALHVVLPPLRGAIFPREGRPLDAADDPETAWFHVAHDLRKEIDRLLLLGLDSYKISLSPTQFSEEYQSFAARTMVQRQSTGDVLALHNLDLPRTPTPPQPHPPNLTGQHATHAQSTTPPEPSHNPTLQRALLALAALLLLAALSALAWLISLKINEKQTSEHRALQDAQITHPQDHDTSETKEDSHADRAPQADMDAGPEPQPVSMNPDAAPSADLGADADADTTSTHDHNGDAQPDAVNAHPPDRNQPSLKQLQDEQAHDKLRRAHFDRLRRSPQPNALAAKDWMLLDLRGEDLKAENLSRSRLWKADLRGADLRGADLTAADLTAADLRGADLRGADLRGADLTAADLRGADLTNANTEGAIIDKAILDDQTRTPKDLKAPANINRAPSPRR
jgi:hypothetical protein